MKIVLPLLISISVLSSCKKENAGDFRNKIKGSWELEKTVCGECITPVSNFPQGNGNIIILSADGDYQRMKQDTILFSGNYTLHESKDCFARSSNYTFSTNENATVTSYGYISLENSKLVFDTPNCFADGGTTIYRRIQ